MLSILELQSFYSKNNGEGKESLAVHKCTPSFVFIYPSYMYIPISVHKFTTSCPFGPTSAVWTSSPNFMYLYLQL